MKINSIQFIKNKVIIFDCFGTLLKIKIKKNPHFNLFKDLGILTKENIKKILTTKISIENYNEVFNIKLTNKNIDDFYNNLSIELNSIEIIPGVLEKIEELKNQNKKIMICSNLSLEYVNKLSILPINEKILSCDIGLIKPQKEMYEYCISKAKTNPENICFIGDNIINDYKNPNKIGMSAILLKQ